MRSSLRIVAAVSLFVAFGVAAIGQTTEPARKNAWTIPHVLRFATAEDVVGLNIHLNHQVTLRNLTSLTMASLLRTGADNLFVPELATVVPSKGNGGISRDGMTFTYHLRRDAKWSDGQPFNADDVLFSTSVVQNPANNEQDRDGFTEIDRITAPDPYTVVVHLTKIRADFTSLFFSSGSVPLLPKHLLGNLPDINHADYNALPIGIGPFKFKQWRRGDAIELVADPLYFRGKPRLERIVFKIIPDRNTTMAQLQTHEIDMWTLVPGAYIERVQATPGVVLTKVDGFAYNHIDFELEHPDVADPIVRRALRLATDRATILHKIGHDVGLLSEWPMPPSHPGYPAHPLPLVAFDIARANAMLDAGGWKRGADGIRAKNGVRLDLSVGTQSGLEDIDQQLELMRSWWKEIGVAMEVGHYATGSWFAPLQAGGIIQSGKNDVVLYAWSTDSFGDMTNTFGCNAAPPHGQNSMRYCNKSVDRAMAAYVREYDPAKRKLLSDAIERGYVEDAPTIVTNVRQNVYAHNSDLRGFAPNSVYPFDNAMNIDL